MNGSTIVSPYLQRQAGRERNMVRQICAQKCAVAGHLWARLSGRQGRALACLRCSTRTRLDAIDRLADAIAGRA